MIALPSLSIRAWGMIGTGLVIAALFVALFATRATLADTKHERSEAIITHSVTKASLERALTEMARMTAEQKALANSDANRITASRQIVEMADAVAKVRQAAIDRLEQSVENMMSSTPDDGQCEASNELLQEWAA